jgi:hypothetical protein
MKYFTLFIIILTFTTSCTTYYITTDSLRNQFSDVDSAKLRTVTVRGPVGERYEYLANPINEILLRPHLCDRFNLKRFSVAIYFFNQ